VSASARPRRVAITGARGLLGSAVAAALTARGDIVIRLVRHAVAAADEARWSPAQGIESPAALGGLDAVVHLAGEGIADARWTPERKRALRESRVPATEKLARSLAALAPPPATLVAASAVGYYGDRGDEVLTEASAPGRGFLAGLASEWEAAAAPARDAGVRVATLRFGLVLTPRGGLLQKLLPPFRLGLGGPVGRPGAWWSWVALDDVVGLVLHALDTPSLAGPCNVVAPEAVTTARFAVALGRAVHRPAIFPVPAFALRLAFGEMADEMMLSSARVEPRVARETGYVFAEPRLDAALAHLLGGPHTHATERPA
jgi:uncharacterized protein